jgi:hypothetical protein
MKYIIIAYRWANKNDHHYELGYFGELKSAIDKAEQETYFRAGKYSCVVFDLRKNKSVHITEIPEHYKLGKDRIELKKEMKYEE